MSVPLSVREQRLAHKLLAPTLAILFLVAFYPLAQVFYTSLTDKSFASGREVNFVGLENYKKLLFVTVRELPRIRDGSGEERFQRAIDVLPREPLRYKELFQISLPGSRWVLGAADPDFMEAVGNTVLFTILAVFLETVLGMVIALTLNAKFRGQGTMRAVMLVPWAVITVVSARIWEFMLAPNRTGLFNTVINQLGLGDGQLSFLTMPGLQIPALVAVDVWKTTSFMALLLLAGLQLIPGDLYKAAEVDGASKPRQFFAITLPLLKPTLAVALIFRTLDSLRVFDVFQVLLGSKAYSMASYNYELLINYREMGPASAVGVLIFLFIALFAIGYMKILGVDRE